MTFSFAFIRRRIQLLRKNPPKTAHCCAREDTVVRFFAGYPKLVSEVWILMFSKLVHGWNFDYRHDREAAEAEKAR